MGNEHSSETSHNIEDGEGLGSLDQNLQIQSVYSDDNYGGEIKILKNKQTQLLYALKTKHCTSHEEYDSILSETKRFKLLKHTSLIEISALLTQKDDGFCSNVFNIQTLFEYCQRNLQESLVQRNSSQNFFKEEDIIQILKLILEGISYLFSYKIYFGNITAKSILVNAENQIKLPIPFLMNNLNHYNRILQNSEKECYLSPELFSQIGLKKFQPQFDMEKSEIFSLGVLGVQLCLLQETNSIYNFADFKINEQVLENLLSNVSKKYSIHLASTLNRFLRLNPGQRCGMGEGVELLNNLSQSNANMKTHTPIHKTINLAPELNKSNDLKHSLQNFSPAKSQGLLHKSNQKQSEGSENKNFDHYQQHFLNPSQSKNNPDFTANSQQFQLSPHNLKPIDDDDDDNNNNNNNNNNFHMAQSLSRSQKKDFQNNQQSPSNFSSVQKADNSLKNIDHMVKEAIQQSSVTKSKYQNSQQLKSFMKDLLKDEVYVPLQPSPQSSNKQKLTSYIRSQKKLPEQSSFNKSQPQFKQKWKK